jgi:hypothetical protein
VTSSLKKSLVAGQDKERKISDEVIRWAKHLLPRKEEGAKAL